MTTDEARTRDELRRIATHVLARRRHDVTGRFGLRATPGGFGTPAFGAADVPEVVRVAGDQLVHERGADVTVTSLIGATLGALADAVGVDLSSPFDVGHDTPPVGAVDIPIEIEAAAAAAIGGWFDIGWRVLDGAVAAAMKPSTIQLWPEHFDAGCSVAIGPGDDDRCNLGASPGDGFSDEPYLYVGPWTAARPGDAGYWNAPFGAVLRRSELVNRDAGVAFLRRGIDLLSRT